MKKRKCVQTVFFEKRGYCEISVFEILRVNSIFDFGLLNTVELQCLEHLGNHEKMLETGVV